MPFGSCPLLVTNFVSASSSSPSILGSVLLLPLYNIGGSSLSLLGGLDVDNGLSTIPITAYGAANIISATASYFLVGAISQGSAVMINLTVTVVNNVVGVFVSEARKRDAIGLNSNNIESFWSQGTTRPVATSMSGEGIGLSQLCVQLNQADGYCPNLAQGMLAYQSSVLYNALPAFALDGNANPDAGGGSSCTHTDAELSPWWSVDLGSPHPVAQVFIKNRNDCCSGN